MGTTPDGKGAEHRGRRDDQVFHPGEMPPLFGDTGAALIVDDDQMGSVLCRLLGANGVVSSWNPGAERLYGYTTEEIVGQSFDILLPAEKRAEEVDNLARIAAVPAPRRVWIPGPSPLRSERGNGAGRQHR